LPKPPSLESLRGQSARNEGDECYCTGDETCDNDCRNLDYADD